MEKKMIRTKTGECYRVPEEMFPIPAQNLVDCGRADWVEPKKPGITQNLKIQTAAVLGTVRTAAMRFLPDPGLNTGARR